MSGTNLGAAIAAQSLTRPRARVGTIEDQLALQDVVGYAAARAGDMLDGGLLPGDRVALVDSTSTDYIVTWLACLLAGLPVALVNPSYPGDLVEEMLLPLAPTRVLGPADIAEARRHGTAPVAGLPGLSADRFAVASYMHTSGTTGLPKFCAQSHDYFDRLAGAMAGALDLAPTDTVLAPLPLFHINPLGYGIITALLTGADALTVSAFSASGFWPAVVGEGVTVLVLHAPPVEILKRATAAEQSAGHKVRTMFYADREFLDRFGIPAAVSGYGSTEAGGVSHLKRWLATDAIPDDAGQHGGPPRTDFQWRLDDAGLIQVREREHAALFDGYLTAAGLDAARDDEGWFHTGDLGCLDGEGGLIFLERAAESIRVKGEFVPIPFVENHLATVPGLRDHAIWKRRGDLVDDEVVLYAVADDVPVDALRDRIGTLPDFMRPVAIAHVADLPRDAAAGKVQRRLLAEHPVAAWIELRA